MNLVLVLLPASPHGTGKADPEAQGDPGRPAATRRGCLPGLSWTSAELRCDLSHKGLKNSRTKPAAVRAPGIMSYCQLAPVDNFQIEKWQTQSKDPLLSPPPRLPLVSGPKTLGAEGSRRPISRFIYSCRTSQQSQCRLLPLTLYWK